jgi:hypothetical protein
MAATPGVHEELKDSGKADPAVAALIQRVKTGGRPSVDESRFVFSGEAYVRVTVSDASPAGLAALRNAGFTITRQEGNVIVGRIAVEKLEALSKLPVVSRIAVR